MKIFKSGIFIFGLLLLNNFIKTGSESLNGIDLDFFLANDSKIRTINDDDLPYEEFPFNYIFISLGNCCKTAAYIRATKLNTFSYPFDWNLSPFDALFNVIENDFNDWFKLENLEDLNYFDGKLNIIWDKNKLPNKFVLDKKYGIESRHDFPHDINLFESYKEVSAKYQRRISRFYRAINAGKTVYFIRRGINKEQALRLSLLISQKFPHLSFYIIALDGTEEIKDNWNIPHVKNYYFDDQVYVYDNNLKKYVLSAIYRQAEWNGIIASLGIN